MKKLEGLFYQNKNDYAMFTVKLIVKSKMDTKHKTDKSEPNRLGFVYFLFGETELRGGHPN